MDALDASARVLVTGGTGFVGRSLLRWLAGLAPAARPSLTVVSRSPQAFACAYPQLAQGVDFVEGDVASFAPPAGAFTHVLHGAADTSMAAAAEAEVEAERLAQAIVGGARHVLEVAEAVGAGRVLFLSSGAVYGPQPESLLEIPESYSGTPREDDPSGAYGRAKRRAERACFEWGEKTGRAVVVARLFAFVGEELPLDAHFAIGNFIRDALAGGPISVKGDGTPVRTYLAASCLAEWLWVLLARGNPGWAFNVGSDEAIDMASLARLVADVVSPGAEVKVARARADYAGRQRYVPSIALARSELGVSVRVPLAEAIRRVAAWHRARAPALGG